MVGAARYIGWALLVYCELLLRKTQPELLARLGSMHQPVLVQYQYYLSSDVAVWVWSSIVQRGGNGRAQHDKPPYGGGALFVYCYYYCCVRHSQSCWLGSEAYNSQYSYNILPVSPDVAVCVCLVAQSVGGGDLSRCIACIPGIYDTVLVCTSNRCLQV